MMTRKFLKGLVLLFGILVVLAAGFYTRSFIDEGSAINKIYELIPQSFILSKDSPPEGIWNRLIT